MADPPPAATLSGFGSGVRASGPADRTFARCPCGGMPVGAPLPDCCGPVVAGERQASTAEQLMRSRYTAYVQRDADHLFRTWHPRTRPDDTAPDERVRWVGLDVLDVVAGGEGDTEGLVEFRAHWVSDDDGPARRGELHERSRFVRRSGRWVYLSAE